MFTGIIEEIGKVQSLHHGHPARLVVSARIVMPGLKPGDSIAVNGVCLTVTTTAGELFSSDLSAETIERSSLGTLREGSFVNLERALTFGERLGGHFVQGHVDTVGRIASIVPAGEGAVISVEYPTEIGRYLVQKGSIAVDGISLTIASLREGLFTVAVIPHTIKATNLSVIRVGDMVNLEADILGKYVERLMRPGIQPNESSKWSLGYLKEQGF